MSTVPAGARSGSTTNWTDRRGSQPRHGVRSDSPAVPRGGSAVGQRGHSADGGPRHPAAGVIVNRNSEPIRVVLVAFPIGDEADGRGAGRGLASDGDGVAEAVHRARRHRAGQHPKPGRPRTVDGVAVLQSTLEPPPEQLGVTHWSTRLLADHLKISNYTVSKVWRRWGLQPWRRETRRLQAVDHPHSSLEFVTQLNGPRVRSA